MKQSQNAITFLTAQYRSVYGRAYMKGLATAFVVSSAVVAPEVAAEVLSGAPSFDQLDNTNSDIKPTVSEDHTIDQDKNHFSKLAITTGTLSINNGDSLYVRDSLSLHTGTTINVGTSGDGYIYGRDASFTPNQTTGTVTALPRKLIVGSEANNSTGNIDVRFIRLGNNDTPSTTASVNVNIEGPADTTWDKHSQIIGGTGETTRSSGVSIETRANVTIGNNGTLAVDTGGTMDIKGTAVVNLSGSESILRGADNFDQTGFDTSNTETAGVINLSESGSINVTGTNTGIYAPTVNISGGSVNVSAGGVLNLDGDMIKAGTSLADAGHAAADITITGGIINIEEGGKVVVGRGTYGTTDPAWTGKEQTTLTVRDNGQLSGAGTLEVQGTANLTQNVLEGFTKTSSGNVVLNNGTLQLSGNNQIELSGYSFSNLEDDTKTATAHISVISNSNTGVSTIEANNIKIANSIGNNDTLNLNVKARTLELNSETDPAANNLGFNSAIVSNNVTFDATNSDDKKFHLQNEVVLADTQNDGVRSSGDLVVEDVYQVAAGEGTHTGNITLAGKSQNSSTFKIGGGDANASFVIKSGTPNHLANFTINNTSGSNNIIVAAKDGYQATLDFGTKTTSDVNLTLVRDTNGANLTKITVGDASATNPTDGASKIVLTENDFTEVIDFGARGSGTGAYVVLNKGGELEVEGSANLQTAQLGYSTGTGTATDTDKIFLNGGRFKAQTVNLAKTEGNNLLIDGTIAAENLDLTGQSGDAGAFEVVSGTLEVSNSLVSNTTDTNLHVNEIKLTGSERPTNNATLILNAADGATHALGTNVRLDTSTGTGTAVFNVSNGTWQAADPINDKLTVTAIGTGSTINVGDGNHDLRANLNVNDLSVTNGAILNISSDGQVAVNGGTADFSNNGVVSGMGTLAATNGTVKMTQDTLNNFVGVQDSANPTNPDLGQVVLTDSTLDLSDGTGNIVDLGKYIVATDTANTSGDLVITDSDTTVSSTIKANDLAVSQDMTQGAQEQLDLDLEATDSITFGDGNNAFDNVSKNFKSATASNIKFDTAGNPVTLSGNSINVRADNLGFGGSEGNVALTGESDYNVTSGYVTHTGDMELAGGSLNVGAGAGQGYEGQDATLAFESSDPTGQTPAVFKINNTGTGNNTIAIKGNGYVTDPSEAVTSTLDLSDVDLQVIRGTNLTTIQVGENATTSPNASDAVLVVNDTDFGDLVQNQTTTPATDSGALIELAGNGVVQIKSADPTTATPINLATSQLKAGEGLVGGATDTVYFNQGGTLEGEIFKITAQTDPAASAPDSLNIGSGTLRANQALDLSDNGTDATSFTVAGGNIEVGNKLTSNNTSISFDGGAGNDVSLVLGNASTTTGEVSVALDFKGGTNAAELSVNHGTWTVQDITAYNTNINIGQGQTPAPTTPNVSVTGTTLSLGDASHLAVHNDALAVFNDINLGGGSQALVEGDLTAQNSVSGDYNAGDLINVSGATASFTFGDLAKNQIQQDASGNITVTGGAKDLFELDGNGSINLNLGADIKLNSDSIAQLRDELFASVNTGNSYEALTDGVINVGGAVIDGLEVIEDGTNPSTGDPIFAVSDDNLADIGLGTDITNDQLKNATLVGVDGTKDIGYDVGNVRVNQGVKEITFDNANLYAARDYNDGTGPQFVYEEGVGAVNDINVKNSLGLHNGGNIENIHLQGEGATISVSADDATTVTTIESIESSMGTDTRFIVEGTTVVNKGASVDNLNGNGYTLQANSLDVSTSTYYTGDIEVENTANFGGKTVINGSINVGGQANFSGDTSITNTDPSKNNVFEQDTSFTGTTTLSGSNTFNGAANFDSTTAADDYTLLAGDNTFNGAADFKGVTELSGNNQFTATSSTVSFSGDNTLYGDNTFKGATSLTSSGTDLNNKAAENFLQGNNTFEGTANFSGSTTLSGSNTFADNAVFDSTGTNGVGEANKTALQGNNTFSKDATFTGDTTLTGNNTFNGSGNIVSFSGTNTITGSNRFEGSGSTIDFSGDTTLTGASVNGVGSGNVFAADTKVNFTGNTTLAGSNTFNGEVYFDSTQGTVAGTSGSNTIAGGTFNGTTDFKGETKLNGGNTFASGATFNDATTISGGNIFNGGASFSGTAVISDNNAFSGTTVFGDKAEISGNNTFADVKYDTTTTQIKNTISGNMTADSITFNGTDNTLHVQNGNVKVANAVTVSGTGNVLQVGSDGTTSALGTLEAENIVLGGNTLFVDPNYGESTALVAVKNGYVSATEPSDGAPSVVDGNIIIGKNSAVGLGTDLSHLQEQIGLYQENGSLDITGPGNVEGGTGFGSILYLGEATKVGDGNRIVVNSSNSAASLDEVQNFGSGADLALSANSAIIIDRNAFGTDQSQTAISFDKAGAQVYSEGGKIVLTGNYDASKALNVLNDSEGDGVTIAGSDIVVESQNKLFKGTLEQGDNKGTLNLQLQEPALRALNTISDPAKQFLIDKAYSGSPYAQAASLGDTTAIDKAARMGAYSAAAQTALAVNQTMEQAIAARMGMGYGDGQGGSVSFSPTNGRGGFWATPIYRRINGDGFDAQGIDYGADIDMYGLTGGVDIKLTKDIYTGAVLAFGTGSADGNGMASSTSNDFDYFGFGAYLGYRFKNLTVLGDINYSQVDNSVEDTNGVDKISASFDSTNLSLGVSGKLDFKVGNVNVAPHAGLRFSRIEVDDFGVNGAQYGLVANTSNSTLNIFSVPVGVIIASDFKVNDWMLRPSLDFTLQGNFGDDSLDSSVNFIGSSAGAYDFSSEVLDNFTYGLTAGLNVRKDNFNFGIGLNYTGSSNVNEFGIKANARLDF